MSDGVTMTAYGDFKVDYILGVKQDDPGASAEYEIGIAVMPVRVGAACYSPDADGEIGT